MKITAFTLVLSLFALSASSASGQDAGDWRRVANSIPLGSKVKVQTVDGRRISGTLVRVDDLSMMVKRDPRMPEPAVTLTFDRIANIERDHGGGFSWAKAVGVGVGAGVGAMLTLIVILIHID